MADQKAHTEQGQIERAQRLRKVIEDLKASQHGFDASEGESLKEQIEERARGFRKRKTKSRMK
jgi:hypothetical protein